MSRFQYDDLEAGTEQIRLVTVEPTTDRSASIVCSLSTYSLDSAPPYDALSYCWGDSDGAQAVSIGEYQLDVTLNLFQAFRSLRSAEKPITLWVDAVCINQANVLERNRQVPLMIKIYGKADRVIAWLGEETKESKMAAILIRTWSQASQFSPMDTADDIRSFIKEFPKSIDGESWFALGKLMRRPWWNRMWVYQEFVAAQNDPWFVCGSDSWSCAQLTAAGVIWSVIPHVLEVRDLSNLLWIALPGWDPGHFKMMLAHRGVNYSPSIRLSLKDKMGYEWDIISLQDYTHTRESADPRDKLYALLGISDGTDIDLSPDYNQPVGDVYREFTIKCLLGASHRHIINYCTLTSNTAQPSLDIPSWVPDFRASAHRAICLSTKKFKAGGNAPQSLHLTPQTRVLSMLGFLVDEINHKVEPTTEDRMTMIEYMGKWKSFVRDHQTPHPLGITQLQAYFRALVLDTCHSSTDDHLPRTDEDREILFQQAVDFLYTCGYRSREILAHSDPSRYSQWELCRAHNSIYAKLFSLWVHGFAMNSPPVSDEELLRDFLPFSQTQEWIRGLREAARKRNFSGDVEGPFVGKFRSSMYTTTERRMLFSSRNGFLGLGPEHLEEGDQIYVLPGWNTPFILRPEPERAKGFYTLVGEGYVYGLMQGEIIESAARQGTQAQDLRIC